MTPMSDHPALNPDPAGKVSRQAVLSREADGSFHLTGMSMIEQAMLAVGSERTAIRYARRLYGLDARQARLLVTVIREGTADDAPVPEPQP